MLKAVAINSIGAVNYKGTWNANTNNPVLTSGVGVKGDYYVVGTAGTTTIDGISTWYVGDWIVFNGTTWQRVQGGSDDPAPSLLSNSSTGLMQITGPSAGTTRVVTIPNANSTMARTDAAQTFAGTQTISTGGSDAVVNLQTTLALTTLTQSAGDGNTYFLNFGNYSIIIGTNGSEDLRVTAAGNVHAASGTTTMTDGFFYIPAAAGAPTGVPTVISGRVPMYYDTTNNEFYVYNGGWKKVLLS